MGVLLFFIALIHFVINFLVIISVIQDGDFSEYLNYTWKDFIEEKNGVVKISDLLWLWFMIYGVIFLLFCKAINKLGKFTIYKSKKYK